MKKGTVALATALALMFGAASAGTPHAAKGYVAKTERGRLAGQIVRTWSGYVAKVYGTHPGTWANSMAATLASADIGNMRKAARMQTYEAMTATLLGQQMSDAQAIDKLARTDGSPDALKSLGSPANDLVYTMITPCRIADTRVAGGKLSAGSTRHFVSNAPGSNFAPQGGSASSDCGIPADPSAMALMVTVVGTTGSGYLTAFPYGVTRPTASSLNYTGTNQVLANEILVKQTIGGAADFSVFSLAGAHVVIDAVGYFMAPTATALQCQGTSRTAVDLPAGSTNYYYNEACPSGYTAVMPYCYGGNTPGVYSTGSGLNLNTADQLSWCGWSNTTESTQVVAQGVMCCRVPGR
jgi:hypothetical protein